METIKLLLAHGADANGVDNAHHTALRRAVARGHSEAAAALLDGGANVHCKETVELLLARGTEVMTAQLATTETFARYQRWINSCVSRQTSGEP